MNGFCFNVELNPKFILLSFYDRKLINFYELIFHNVVIVLELLIIKLLIIMLKVNI